MFGRNFFPVFGAGDDALNFVAKLTHISRPIAHHQQIYRLRRDADVALAEAG